MSTFTNAREYFSARFPLDGFYITSHRFQTGDSRCIRHFQPVTPFFPNANTDTLYPGAALYRGVIERLTAPYRTFNSFFINCLVTVFCQLQLRTSTQLSRLWFFVSRYHSEVLCLTA